MIYDITFPRNDHRIPAYESLFKVYIQKLTRSIVRSSLNGTKGLVKLSHDII